MSTSEERKGNILVSEHSTWESVKNLLRKPNKTSVNLYYDNDEGVWIVGRVMTQEERVDWDLKEDSRA